MMNSDLTRFVRFALGSCARRHCECFQPLRVSLSRGADGNVFFIISGSVPIQHFLAWRIKNLSHRWLWFFIVSALSLGQGACAFAGGTLASTSSKYSLSPKSGTTVAEFSSLRWNYGSLFPVAGSWISIAVLTDGKSS